MESPPPTPIQDQSINNTTIPPSSLPPFTIPPTVQPIAPIITPSVPPPPPPQNLINDSTVDPRMIQQIYGNIIINKELMGIRNAAMPKPAIEALKGVAQMLDKNIIPVIDLLIPTNYAAIPVYKIDGNINTPTLPLNYLSNYPNITNIPSLTGKTQTYSPPFGNSFKTLNDGVQVFQPPNTSNEIVPIPQIKPINKTDTTNIYDNKTDQQIDKNSRNQVPVFEEVENIDDNQDNNNADENSGNEEPVFEELQNNDNNNDTDDDNNNDNNNDDNNNNDTIKGGSIKGEGTYGCVHTPPLTCDPQRTDGDNKISKIMKTAHAISEIEKYDIIKRIDPKTQFYLGVPELCETVADTEQNVKEIAECKNIEGIDGNSLVVMEDGGVDLWKMCQSPTTLSSQEMPHFWVEFHRTIKGIELFLNEGYLHYDIKPDNIVYNAAKTRINFIDFGLMRKKRDIYEKGVKNGHHVSYHTTYSLEHFFYNKTNYDKILLGSRKDKQRFMTNFKTLTHTAPPVTDKPLTKIYTSLTTLFKWVKDEDTIRRIMIDYEDFIMLEREPNGFLNFIVLATNRFDMYGIGLTIIYVLNHMKTPMKAFHKEMWELAYDMINPNIYKRPDVGSIDEAYVKIMMKYFFVEVVDIKKILKSHNTYSPLTMVERKGGTIRKRNLKLPKIHLRNMKLHTMIGQTRMENYRFINRGFFGIGKRVLKNKKRRRQQ